MGLCGRRFGVAFAAAGTPPRLRSCPRVCLPATVAVSSSSALKYSSSASTARAVPHLFCSGVGLKGKKSVSGTQQYLAVTNFGSGFGGGSLFCSHRLISSTKRSPTMGDLARSRTSCSCCFMMWSITSLKFSCILRLATSTQKKKRMIRLPCANAQRIPDNTSLRDYPLRTRVLSAPG